MSHAREVLRSVVLLSGIAALALASPAGGQVTTQKPKSDTVKKSVAKTPVSAKRIPVKKETSGGDVMLICPIDQDSLNRALAAVNAEKLAALSQAAEVERAAKRRIDAITMETANRLFEAERSNQILRAEVARGEREKADAERIALEKARLRGFYFGVAGGASMPQRNIRNGYAGGWNVTLPLGFDMTSLPLGLRVDGAIDHLNGTVVKDEARVVTASSGHLTVYSVNTDLKLRMQAPGVTRTHLYALGGVGAHWVAGGVYGMTGTNAGDNVQLKDASAKLGWNAGAGATFSWGPAEVFVESRFFQVKSDLPYTAAGGVGTYTSFTPIVIGMQWF
jgi:opacity protein-like surface antigen